MRADSGLMWRKSSRSVRRAISASAPASSTPVGPPPTMTKVSSRRCATGSVSRSAASNASSTRRLIPGHRRASSALAPATPTRDGRNRRAPRRWRRPDSRTRPRSSPRSAVQHDAARSHGSMVRTFGEQHAHVLLMTEDPADRRRDVARRQRRGGHLIQQRLEEMVVVPIDERHPHRRGGERARGIQPAEAAANDHDMGRCTWENAIVPACPLMPARGSVRSRSAALRRSSNRRVRSTARTPAASRSPSPRQGRRDRRRAQQSRDRRLHLREGPQVR